MFSCRSINGIELLTDAFNEDLAAYSECINFPSGCEIRVYSSYTHGDLPKTRTRQSVWIAGLNIKRQGINFIPVVVSPQSPIAKAWAKGLEILRETGEIT